MTSPEPSPAGLGRLWAGWRNEYVSSVAGGTPQKNEDQCVFCRILASGEPDDVTYVLWRGRYCVAILNAYPYNSGHFMVMPIRHVGDLEDLSADESAELWQAVTTGVVALKTAYDPGGVNVGANLGRAAGAGVPDHLHMHCLPRWGGDTNFVTTLAETRVLPESLPVTWERLRAVWPD
ncbi:MAG: HIT family protein [Acidimicrobiales bacterium]